MSRPRTFLHVEWEVARHPDRPNDRVRKERNFATEENAAAQIIAVRLWEPQFAELLGVWRTHGGGDALEWEQIDPESLRASPQAVERYESMATGWQSNPAYLALVEGDE